MFVSDHGCNIAVFISGVLNELCDRKNAFDRQRIIIGIDNDTAAGVNGAYGKIIQIADVAGPADDTRGLRIRKPLADIFIHLILRDLVIHDDKGFSLLIQVGLDQLGNDGVNPVIGSQNDNMVLFHDNGFSASQLLHSVINRIADNTGQGTCQQDADKADHQHKNDIKSRTFSVFRKCPGIHDVQQRCEHAASISRVLVKDQINQQTSPKHRYGGHDKK